MILGQAQTTTFKLNLLKGLENFFTGSPYVYKIALYNALATINSETTAYTTNNEITGGGYTAGGLTLTPTVGSDPSNNTAYVTFANVTWSPANFTAAGALIYNSTTNASVAVLNFGSDKTSTTSFTVQFPAGTSSTAILRIN
jgi:hypothetical protein